MWVFVASGLKCVNDAGADSFTEDSGVHYLSPGFAPVSARPADRNINPPGPGW
jgi:hypothetical protein